MLFGRGVLLFHVRIGAGGSWPFPGRLGGRLVDGHIWFVCRVGMVQLCMWRLRE